ncbi:MAG TPA: flagellar export chaperone FliS [Galbitalea sp.]
MTLTNAGARSIYFRDSVESAPPSKLLTMLYDRLLLDLERAERAQADTEWLAASKVLVHAQAIVTELAGTLKPELWDGGPALMSLYLYVLQLLRTANVNHDAELTRESIELLEPLRQAWHAAADGAGMQTSFAGISAVG